MNGYAGVSRYVPFVLRWLALGVVLLVIEVLIGVGAINEYVVPRPSAIFGALYRVVVEEHVMTYFLITLGEVLAAAAGLVLVGIPFGVFLARKRDYWSAWGNWVAGLAAAPVVLLYPLFLVVFGRSPLTIIMISFVTGVAPVILKTVEGISGTRKVLLDVGRSFNLTEWQIFWKIVIPSALPAMFLGLRLGLIYTMITVVAVEYLITLGGLGSLVGELAERYDLAATYAAVCFVVAVSVVFFLVVERLEHWLRLSA